MPARWHGEPVNLRFDVHDRHGVLLQPSDIDLNVKVSDVGDDGIFEHDLEVLAGDDILVAGGGDEDVGAGGGVFHGRDFETSHSGLEGVDWVDLGDKNASSVRPQSLRALEAAHQNGSSYQMWQLTTYALSDIAVTSNDDNLSSKHDVCGTLNTVDKGLAASIVVVELALGDGVVDIDGGDLELALPVHTVEVVNTGGGLFGETPDSGKELWVFFVNEGGEITTVVENQVQRLAAVETLDRLVNTPEVFLLGLALPGEDGNACNGNGSSGMVLGGEDVLRGDQIRIQRRPGEKKKRTQEDQVTSAPRAVRVSIKTAVWMVMCKHPAIRAPLRGLEAEYFCLMYMRPGISCSAISISLRPKAAREISVDGVP